MLLILILPVRVLTVIICRKILITKSRTVLLDHWHVLRCVERHALALHFQRQLHASVFISRPPGRRLSAPGGPQDCKLPAQEHLGTLRCIPVGTGNLDWVEQLRSFIWGQRPLSCCAARLEDLLNNVETFFLKQNP